MQRGRGPGRLCSSEAAHGGAEQEGDRGSREGKRKQDDSLEGMAELRALL